MSIEPPTAPVGDPTVEPDLWRAALAVQRHAYVPYSHFPVGAAVRSASGSVFVGANIENAAYPQGWCAEASALAAMASAGERVIEAIVTVCDGEALSTPCGGCRQKIREFATPDTLIHAAGPDGVRRTYSMEQLLPDSFGPAHLRPFTGLSRAEES
jgi:cytidine deaminase